MIGQFHAKKTAAEGVEEAGSKSARWFRDRLVRNKDIIDGDYTDEDVYIRSSPPPPPPPHDTDDDADNNDDYDDGRVGGAGFGKRRAKQPFAEQRAQYGRADMPHFDSMMGNQIHHRRYDRHHRGSNFDDIHVPRFDTHGSRGGGVGGGGGGGDHMDEISDRVARLSERLRRRSSSFSSHDSDDNRDIGPSVRTGGGHRRRDDEPVDTDKVIQEMRDRQEQLRKQREQLRKEMHERYDRFHNKPQTDKTSNDDGGGDAFPSSEAIKTTPTTTTTTDSKVVETLVDSSTSTSSTSPPTIEIPAAANTIVPETAAVDPVVTSTATATAADPVVVADPVVTATATATAADSAATAPDATTAVTTATVEPAQDPQPNAILTAEHEPLAKTIETIAEPSKQN